MAIWPKITVMPQRSLSEQRSPVAAARSYFESAGGRSPGTASSISHFASLSLPGSDFAPNFFLLALSRHCPASRALGAS